MKREYTTDDTHIWRVLENEYVQAGLPAKMAYRRIAELYGISVPSVQRMIRTPRLGVRLNSDEAGMDFLRNVLRSRYIKEFYDITENTDAIRKFLKDKHPLISYDATEATIGEIQGNKEKYRDNFVESRIMELFKDIREGKMPEDLEKVPGMKDIFLKLQKLLPKK